MCAVVKCCGHNIDTVASCILSCSEKTKALNGVLAILIQFGQIHIV